MSKELTHKNALRKSLRWVLDGEPLSLREASRLSGIHVSTLSRFMQGKELSAANQRRLWRWVLDFGGRPS